ncbi:dual specificity protein phosphatase family protein [Arenicella sp.]|nr:dual specificity protein phosphatase family protein [Arenicella sp.]
MINFDLVEPGVYIGSAPQSSVDVARLKQMKITSVICLQSDNDLVARKIDWQKLKMSYQHNDISVYRFPINDFDELDLGKKVVEPIVKLNDLLSSKEKVYVHCNAGVCRASSVVLGYLCHYQGMSIEAGLGQIRIARPIANPYKSAVKNALEQLT